MSPNRVHLLQWMAMEALCLLSPWQVGPGGAIEDLPPVFDGVELFDVGISHHMRRADWRCHGRPSLRLRVDPAWEQGLLAGQSTDSFRQLFLHQCGYGLD